MERESERVAERQRERERERGKETTKDVPEDVSGGAPHRLFRKFLRLGSKGHASSSRSEQSTEESNTKPEDFSNTKRERKREKVKYNTERKME